MADLQFDTQPLPDRLVVLDLIGFEMRVGLE